MSIIDDLNKLEKDIRKGETLKVQAETMVRTLQEQYRRNSASLKALGVNPKQAEEDLKKIDLEIEEKLNKLKSLVPTDIIQKYENYNFEGPSDNGENFDF